MTVILSKTSLIFACGLALVVLPHAYAEHTNEHSEEAMFKSKDSDKDGRISRIEHAAGAMKMFNNMDTNHDGVVTATEMDAFHATKSEKSGKGKMSSADTIKVLDTNGDGQLSRAEHEAGSDALFIKMDTNRDGFLSLSECSIGHDSMMKKEKHPN